MCLLPRASLFRFSIRNLFFLVTLLGIIFAFVISRDAGTRYKRVSSISVSPDGSQIAVGLAQGFGSYGLEPLEFSRSVSLIEMEDLQDKSVKHHDNICRDVNVPRSSFWNAQARITHSPDHLFFLNGDQTRLICLDKQTGRKRTVAECTTGTIYSFDTSRKGDLVVIQAEVQVDQPDGFQINIKGKNYFLRKDSESIEKITKAMLEANYPLCIASDLVGESDELICIPDLGKKKADDLASETDDQQNLDVQPDNEDPTESQASEMGTRILFVGNGKPGHKYSRPTNWRTSIFQTPDNEHRIAIVSDAVALLYDQTNLTSVETTDANPKSYRWKTDLLDIATSSGKYRIAKLGKGQLVLNLTSDELPGYKNINVMIQCDTDLTSATVLSRDGKYVAVSNNDGFKVFETGNMFTTYVPGMLDELAANGHIAVNEYGPSLTIQTDYAVTAMDFDSEGKFLVVGDECGRLSKYRLSDGTCVDSTMAPGRTMGLPRVVVIGIAILWLMCVATWLVHNKSYDEIVELVDEDEIIQSVDDIK